MRYPQHPHLIHIVALVGAAFLLYRGDGYWIFAADVVSAMAVFTALFALWSLYRRFHETSTNTISQSEEP